MQKNTSLRSSSKPSTSSRARVLGVVVIAALALTGCGASAGASAGAVSEQATHSHVDAASETAGEVIIHDPWVKAVDSGMTAAFGVVENPSDQPLHVVAASSSIAKEVQLHETKPGADGTMKMSEVDGGFTIPAKGKLTLEPGGNHLMFMGVNTAVKPGEDVTVTLTFADESTFEFTAPVKEFTGANENYSHGTK